MNTLLMAIGQKVANSKKPRIISEHYVDPEDAMYDEMAQQEALVNGYMLALGQIRGPINNEIKKENKMGEKIKASTYTAPDGTIRRYDSDDVRAIVAPKNGLKPRAGYSLTQEEINLLSPNSYLRYLKARSSK